MTKYALLLAALSLAAACEGSTDPDPDPAQGWDTFSTNSLDAYDLVGIGEPGSWQIGGGVLTAAGPADQNVLVRKDDRFGNGYVEAISSRADDGGLVLRFTSESSYYLLAFRDDEAPSPRNLMNLAIYRRANSEFRELATRDIIWPRGASRTIRFEAEGETLRGYVNGAMVIEVTGEVMLAPGRFGVRHFGYDAGWITTFDRMSWFDAEAD